MYIRTTLLILLEHANRIVKNKIIHFATPILWVVHIDMANGEGHFVSRLAKYFSRSKFGSSGLDITIEKEEMSGLETNVIMGH